MYHFKKLQLVYKKEKNGKRTSKQDEKEREQLDGQSNIQPIAQHNSVWGDDNTFPSSKGEEKQKVKYFDGRVADGTSTMRVICFNPKARAALLRSVEEKKPVALINCNIQKSQISSIDELEVVIDPSTQIKEAEVAIDVSTLPQKQFTSLDAALDIFPNQQTNFQSWLT